MIENGSRNQNGVVEVDGQLLDLVSSEIKEIILKYKESQEFIDRRESASNRALCKQIRLYEQLRQKWQVGHIQCRPKQCIPGLKCECMRVYGCFRDLSGRIKKCFLGISIEHAIAYCDSRRVSYMDDVWILIGYARASFR